MAAVSALSGGHLAQRVRRYEKISVVAQDRFLKLAQRRRGLHAQLLDEGTATLPEDPQGVVLPA